MSSKESQEEVKIIANLTESQSEQNKVAKQKILIPRTIDVNNTNAKLNTTAVTEINKISWNLKQSNFSQYSNSVWAVKNEELPIYKTIQQLKSCRSPNGSAFTNPQAPKTVQSDKPEFPLGAGKALKLYMNKMSDYEKGEILDYRQVYFLGLDGKKVQGTPLKKPNYGFDNDKGDYKVVLRDHIAYRYEVLDFLGKGSFGVALKCFDHKTNEYVWVKVIRNQEKFQYQASIEVKVLQHIKDTDPEDTSNLIKMKDYFIFRSHVCLVFELLSMNLYEFIKNTDFRGVSMGLIRRFAIQLLHSLKFIKEQEIIHWDLKPENILLKTPTKSGIKIIDFGSSWFMDEIVYTYIQSRFYRAPEIMLGIPYQAAIDMWSFGWIIAELFWGLPLFPGESEREQMSLLIEILDVPNDVVIAKSPYRHKFFDKENKAYIMDNIKGEKKVPASKPLPLMIEWDDENFLDFIEKWLDWDPETRMTPDGALRHVWILEGLPKNVLYHHWKMYDIADEEVSFNL
jgi:dual specificity tyrosine-phosphorylation-regulated kinase 2/3/4